MIFAQVSMFFFAVFVVLWVWFLQDFHTKKTKTERQGDRDIQHSPRGVTPNSPHKVPAIPHKGQN